MNVYLNDWEKGGWFQMVADFSNVNITKEEYEAETAPYANVEYWREELEEMRKALSRPEWDGIEVLLASYTAASYEGDAFVLFRKDGKLYEVNASHCSCYGVEGQWKPEETNVISLRKRMDDGELGNNEWTENMFANELREVLSSLEIEQ